MSDQLSESVVKKIQLAKILYFDGLNSFKANNLEQVGVGLLLLQDAIEIFLIALAEHIKAPIDNKMDIYKYFKAIEDKTTEQLPLKKQLLNLNQQRTNLKHFGFLPNIDDCKNFPIIVQEFFNQLSEKYFDLNIDEISLLNLLLPSQSKELLVRAEYNLKDKDYKSCQINCRKALYLLYEYLYDIRQYYEEKENLFGKYSKAPVYARNKNYIDQHVNEPTDYIILDHSELERELLSDGIVPFNFWNIWRLTPKVYYFNDSHNWIIKEESHDAEMYNKENSAYCFRTTVEIALLNQKQKEKQRYIKGDRVQRITIQKRLTIYKKASNKSDVIGSLEKEENVLCSHSTEGFDGKIYCFIFSHKIIDGKFTDLKFGYICYEDENHIVIQHEKGTVPN